MIFKVRYTKSRGHIYCTLFVAKDFDLTWANCGKLTLRLDEFPDFKRLLANAPFEEYNNDTNGVR